VGTAPKAFYWLLRSEDTGSEFPIEEDNWIAAAEFADSVGADVINSSLGYTVFDDDNMSHTYEQMDGNTCRVTIGADLAVSKGMIVVNSAGNSGNDNWKYVGAPADGDSVLAIGAVDASGNYASFSSIGPTYDGRTKPDVVAQGQDTYVVSSDGNVNTSNGTSFASPVLAGLVTCLWQANPNKKNTDIIDAIKKSASQYNTPDKYLGYGIPNFPVAHKILSGFTAYNKPGENSFNLYPNPFSSELMVILNVLNIDNANIEIIDLKGKLVYTKENIVLYKGCNYILIDNLDKLIKGTYIVRVRTTISGTSFSHKLIKS
jgi:serine protease AprX